MPSRNTVKEYAAEEYYHVYNRGVEKRDIFLDKQDYTVFIGLLKKYLAGEIPPSHNRHGFKKLNDEVEVLSYCLMPNHFHMLLYQKTEDGVTKLMRRLATGYVMYFNNKYKRVGGLFQGRFKASRINADDYLEHISRYIHLNPLEYKNWPYSSYAFYRKNKTAEWLSTERILSLFDDDHNKYAAFVDDYVDNKKELDELKWQLAAYEE